MKLQMSGRERKHAFGGGVGGLGGWSDKLFASTVTLHKRLRRSDKIYLAQGRTNRSTGRCLDTWFSSWIAVHHLKWIFMPLLFKLKKIDLCSQHGAKSWFELLANEALLLLCVWKEPKQSGQKHGEEDKSAIITKQRGAVTNLDDILVGYLYPLWHHKENISETMCFSRCLLKRGAGKMSKGWTSTTSWKVTDYGS